MMIESISDFYRRTQEKGLIMGNAYSPEEEHFNIQPSKCNVGKVSFSYRDFYKVALILETGKLFYADKWIMVDRPAILFSNPLIPYAWEAVSKGNESGCYCIFNERFIKGGERNSLLMESPLFDVSKERIYFLDDETLKNVQEIFAKMAVETKSEHPQKMGAIRSYLQLLVHEAMKMQPKSEYVAHRNAAQRIVELFLTLLERQFPVELPHKVLSLKTPADYANRLSVHVNHLNRVVKSTTGRTTSQLITNRIVQESIQLIKYSDFSIAEIAFALGFEEPASFSNFMKKHTAMSPTAHRSPIVV